MAKVGIKISILINNYNYSRYLGACIESALGQSQRAHEVIVVDDGSTDSSLQIAETYLPRIHIVKKKNGGQASAYNSGFEASGGDWILFLDADDLLDPDCLKGLSSFLAPECSKLQFQLRLIGERGQLLRGKVPTGCMNSRWARSQALLFGAYIGPPASGNIYSRDFLSKILPVSTPERFRYAADYVPFILSPFYGQVRDCSQVLGSYRRHPGAHAAVLGESPSDISKGWEADVWKELGLERFRRRYFMQEAKRRWALNTCGRSSPTTIKFSLVALSLGGRRSQRLRRLRRPGHTFHLLRSVFQWKGYNFRQKILFLLWSIGILYGPSVLKTRFSDWALLGPKRPRVF